MASTEKGADLFCGPVGSTKSCKINQSPFSQVYGMRGRLRRENKSVPFFLCFSFQHLGLFLFLDSVAYRFW